MPTATANNPSDLKGLLSTKEYVAIPKEGDTIQGTVIAISSREALVDIPGYKTGVVRGFELRDVENVYPDLKVGDTVEATVLELENDEGHLELSFRYAGAVRVWEAAEAAKRSQESQEIKITDANRGGLMATWKGMKGFLPVSQLAPENYPRVPGGDKGKILEKLRSFIGKTMRVRVLDCDFNEEKLIFSEKALWEEEQKDLLTKYKVGDIIEGIITAVADFGVFVKFSGQGAAGEGLEGLVHISEIAWQRIDNPGDLVKVGQRVSARILNIQGSKIFLSMKALQEDPWKKVHERYSAGQTVNGKVLKVNPFGLFVELDSEIHGLAHISELNIKEGIPLEEQIKPGEVHAFRVVSIEPEHHRLGLSEKALSKPEGQESIEQGSPEPQAGNGDQKHDIIANAQVPISNELSND